VAPPIRNKLSWGAALLLWFHPPGTNLAGVLLCVAMALPVWWISLFSGNFLYIYNCKVFL
jgi:hypothetical protein